MQSTLSPCNPLNGDYNMGTVFLEIGSPPPCDVPNMTLNCIH